MIFLYFSHVFLKNFRKIRKIRFLEFANNCLRITVFSTRFLQNISFLKISLRRFFKFRVFSRFSCPKRGQNGADFCQKIKISCKNFMLTIIFILRYFSSRIDTQNLIPNKQLSNCKFDKKEAHHSDVLLFYQNGAFNHSTRVTPTPARCSSSE